MLTLLLASASAFFTAFMLSGMSGKLLRKGRGKGFHATPAWMARIHPFIRRKTDPATYLEQMPEMIDIVVLGLSAGLSFDMALSSYLTRYDTELARGLRDARLAWNIGAQTRVEALTAFALSSGLKALDDFSTAVGESIELGAPLIASLERQSVQVRAERRALIEERIEKAPVRMLVPLGTLILPAMLLLVMGPVLLEVAGGF